MIIFESFQGPRPHAALVLACTQYSIANDKPAPPFLSLLLFTFTCLATVGFSVLVRRITTIMIVNVEMFNRTIEAG